MSTAGNHQTKPSGEHGRPAAVLLARLLVSRHLPLILVVGINLLVFYLFAYGEYTGLVYPWVVAQTSLLGMWSAIAAAPWVVRLQVLLIGVAALALVNSYWPNPWQSFVYDVASSTTTWQATLALLMHAGCVHAVLSAVRFSGNLCIECPEGSARSSSAARSRGQFTLGQLMLWTACCALWFGVIATGVPEDWRGTASYCFELTPLVGCITIVTLATIWLVLGKSGILCRAALLLASFAAAWLVGLWLHLFARVGLYAMTIWSMTLGLQILLLFPILLVMRLLGWRLRFDRIARASC